METDSKSVHTQKRMELKVKELESRIDLEQTTKSRLEVCTCSCFLVIFFRFFIVVPSHGVLERNRSLT